MIYVCSVCLSFLKSRGRTCKICGTEQAGRWNVPAIRGTGNNFDFDEEYAREDMEGKLQTYTLKYVKRARKISGAL